MGLDEIYAFNSQNDIDRLSLSVRKTEGRIRGGGGTTSGNGKVVYAKVTELVTDIDGTDPEGKVAKGIEYAYDSDTFLKSERADPRVFDVNDETINKTGYIYSDTVMTVGQVVEVFVYTDPDLKEDQVNNMQWLARISGGAERPVIMSAGESFEFGAIITSPSDLTPIKIFTEEDAISFTGIMPWSNVNGLHTAELPEDFIYVGDLNGSIYYTESYPRTLWAKPLGDYPTGGGGITSFEILDSCSDTANVLLSTNDNPVISELILAGFDSASASTTVQEYFVGKYFPCSYDYVSYNFFFTHPIF